MSTTMERMIGDTQTMRSYSLTGPRGGTGWAVQELVDGRVAIIGPDTHGIIPDWVMAYLPAGHTFVRAGGTTYRWSGWVSRPLPEYPLSSPSCVCHAGVGVGYDRESGLRFYQDQDGSRRWAKVNR